jgi:quercetin dioxygenase-like cupin family protein
MKWGHSYIDNASTDLLVHPDEIGAPCFNKLFFPASQRQTPHTHPSFRMTCVIDGEGFCKVPDLPPIRISRGDRFVIPTGGIHSINTGDQTLTLVTFHPESIGPGNPMLDSTILDEEQNP